MPISRSMQFPESFSDKENHSVWYADAMEHLIDVVQDLSHARDLDTISQIVRNAARNLTGADGATFVLRDNEQCYYIEENAISPLWKGQKFPIETCVSGWVMLNKTSVTISDIYSDARVPVDAYRPTFVKSMVMVPIRRSQPIGAIGNYWATQRQISSDELKILEALANVTSIALENVDLYSQLHEKIQALENSNHELSRFAWAASHDLKSPLRAIENLSKLLEKDVANHSEDMIKDHLGKLRRSTQRMERLLDDILEYALIENKLSAQWNDFLQGKNILNDVMEILEIPPQFTIHASDKFETVYFKRMPLQQILNNLVGNSIKHRSKDSGNVWIDVEESGSQYIFSVKDDGPGIESRYHHKIFEMFQTLKPKDQVEGSGMGLALVKKILKSNKGTISVKSELGNGCTFFFTLPKINIK